MSIRKQAVIVPVGTGTGINPLDTQQVNVPAAPWSDGSPIAATARSETAPTRGVMTPARPVPMTQTEIFVAALREELAAFRRERDA